MNNCHSQFSLGSERNNRSPLILILPDPIDSDSNRGEMDAENNVQDTTAALFGFPATSHAKLEQTLAVIKPDAVEQAEEIINLLRREGFTILQVTIHDSRALSSTSLTHESPVDSDLAQNSPYLAHGFPYDS